MRRLVFNGGDILFAVGKSFEVVRPREESYEEAITAIIHGWPADAVVLFGDERPIHRAASDAAHRLGVPVFCFEEGYIRPDYVTFELGGNNANSLLAGTFVADAPLDPPPPAPALESSTYAMTRAAMVYFGALRLSHFLFPRYRHHRERRIRTEFRYWTRALWRRFVSRRHDAEFFARLNRPDHPPFFVLSLQVHDDMQLVRHGRGWTTRIFLEQALDSFRRAAPADCHLVVKAHPLDIGYGHHKKNLRYLVEGSGLGGRVSYLEAGPFMPLVRHARGLVTINSTTGIAALGAGIPVLSVGDAFYQGEGLAFRPETTEEFDSFWVNPRPVDSEKTARFKEHVRRHALVPGSFYLRHTWPSLGEGVVARLRAALGDRE
ncbi:capsular polysaccharide export protein, LipB/KpsS family [Pinisolibacter sp.]|uniref:capsular polysaccharide export protein, LipB/KpsS family n=1 Tax=Pinisolibacter sp. TaxID=2172024 RepID=UPI002FDC9644